MMKQTVKIRCKNNGETKEIAIGSTLKEAYEAFGLSMEFGPINATVNNRTEGLNYRLYHNKDVEYFDLHSATGERCYMRTLFFVLCQSVHDLYPDSKVVIDIPVSNGYYCNLMLGHDVTETDVTRIRERMRQLIDAKLPIRRYEVPTEEAVRIFSSRGDKAKAKLLRSTGKLYTTYYEIDDYVDNFYGSLLINTSQLTLFGLEKYFDGALLRLPSRQNPAELGALIRQDKMFDIFKEQHRWNRILGVSTVGDFNEAVRLGQTTGLINVSEALQEKKIASIAEQIAHRQGTRVVLIAGPQEQKFHIYISALTTILLDDHNYIRTTDNRLLRRIIRDYKYRGVNAQETIHRWPSVRAGENKWIFPYQENADVMFNTAMLFELAVIKQQAEPLLDLVPENCPEYAEAYRLRTFLDYIQPIPNRALPPTSLLREFLGGSSFKY